MTRPNEEADRLWIMASEQRRTADYLEAQAANLRPSRTPMDHHRYFRWIAERDCRRGPSCDHSGCAMCHYCKLAIHPFGADHVRERVPERAPGLAQVLAEALTDTLGCADHAGRCAHVDHVIPVAAGGSNDLPNLVLACVPCNLAKGTRSAEDFRLRLTLDQLELLSEYYAGGGDATLVQGLLDLVHDVIPERLWPSWVRAAMAPEALGA